MTRTVHTDTSKALTRSVILLVFLCVCLLLVVLDTAILMSLTSAHKAAQVEFNRLVAVKIETRIAQEAARLQFIENLPGLGTLLIAGNQMPQATTLERHSSIQSMKQDWPSLSENDPRVRSVLDNPLGDILHRMTDNAPFVNLLLLTDGGGILQAASKKTSFYDFSEESWWKQSVGEENSRVASEGYTHNNQLGLTYVFSVRGGTNSVRGVVREEISLPLFTMDLVEPPIGGAALAAMLISRGGTWFAAPSSIQNAAPDITDHLMRGEHEGWHNGFRFTSVPLNAGVAWKNPIWIVVVRKEGLLPAGIYAPMSAVIAITISVAICCVVILQRLFRARYVKPLHDTVEAGDWILRTAFKRDSILSAHASPSKMETRLERWKHDLVQNIRDDYSSKNEEVQRDLTLAKDFQLAYLNRPYPRIPAVHLEGHLRLNFYHCYQPALALGGDFFDILTLRPDCAGVFIGDVMGHGTRSALITSIIRTLIDDLSAQGQNARHFITELNREFCGMLGAIPSPLFASAFYFVADTTARVGTYSSAGHPVPFHVRRGVGRVERLPAPAASGAALGLIPDESYTGGYCRLEDGDLFILFTDGAYEARNAAGEEFGLARTEKTIQTLIYRSAKEIVDGLLAAISEFVEDEPLADDICIVAIEVTTKPLAEQG